MVRVIVIAAVLLTCGIAGFRELKNYLEYPCLQIVETPRMKQEIILYHRGMRNRAATLFVAPAQPQDPPHPVTLVNYGEVGGIESPPPCGELRWTKDQSSLYAKGRNARGEASQEILWVYDIHSKNLLLQGDIDETTGHTFTSPVLNKIVTLKGGGGKLVTTWYEMGKKSDYLYSWKAAHWDRLAKAASAP